jgi:glyoxylase-like metal-dependent hydrolase (beta-lactamase superfamily II)
MRGYFMSKPSLIYAKKKQLISTGIYILILTATSCLSSAEEQHPRPEGGQIIVQPVRKNVFMLAGAGANITVQVGEDGVLLVDTGSGPLSDKVIAAIRKLSDKPIYFIINTSANPDHTGGNFIISKAGQNQRDVHLKAEIIAPLAVQDAMAAPKGNVAPRPSGEWPSDTFTTPQKDFYFNDEPVVILREPSAYSDGDSMVFLRRSDVVCAGEIFNLMNYPLIDLDKGGSINGIIDALNRLLVITVPKKNEDGGTMVIPAHGHVSDEGDVVYYRDMLTIIRDRVIAMIKEGMTLAQVEAAKPTLDYDPLFKDAGSSWTADKFVEAVYASLQKGH